jgi:hypothetical protein
MKRRLHAIGVLIFLLLPSVDALAAGEVEAQDVCARFAVIGDFGEVGQPAADVAALVKSWNPEFIITTGDNNYPSGAAATIDANIGQYYHEFIYPYTGSYGEGAGINRFFPSLGNHDWQAEDAQPYLDYFTLPHNERYYDFVWPPVHFFVVDSDSREPDGRSATSDQADWIRERMVASNMPWQIVYMHHPPYSSGNHGSIKQMQWPYREWGADAVLAGHDHLYERLIVGGLPYFVNGLGGRDKIYNFGTPLPGSMARYNDDFGAMNVVACLETITFEFFTREGVLVDRYEHAGQTLFTEAVYFPFKIQMKD